MRFEIFDGLGRGLMECHEISCIPDERQLKIMNKSGYKFKLNGKSISVKRLIEFVKEGAKNGENFS